MSRHRAPTANRGTIQMWAHDSWWRKLVAILGSFALVVGLGVVGGSTASADPGDEPSLRIVKKANGSPSTEISPGGGLTYTISVYCDEMSCIGATLDDVFPDALEDFTVGTVSIAGPSQRAVTWHYNNGNHGSNAPSTITKDTELQITWNEPTTNPSGGGLEYNTGFDITIPLTAPSASHYEPGTYKWDNTATLSATNVTNSVDDTATVTMNVPAKPDVDLTKSWSNHSGVYQADKKSTITLTASIGSGATVPVNTLVVQDPQTAHDNATALGTHNPFDFVDLDGNTVSVTKPAGAKDAQLDVYQDNSGTYSWVTGSTVDISGKSAGDSVSLSLPGSVQAKNVAGVRVTFTGSDGDGNGLITQSASSTITLNVKQRATSRGGTDLTTGKHSATNKAEATAEITSGNPVHSAAESNPAHAYATATYSISKATPGVTVTKNIAAHNPAKTGSNKNQTVTAGDYAIATITAKNTSNSAVKKLTLADKKFFTKDITFGGFTSSITWPNGAAAAYVKYFYSDGSDSGEVNFNSGATPTGPSSLSNPNTPLPSTEHVTGFVIVFTSSSHNLGKQKVTAKFKINTDANMSATDRTNTATGTVYPVNGDPVPDSKSKTLHVVQPSLTVTPDKTLTPNDGVHQNLYVTANLTATPEVGSDYVHTTQITLEDSERSQDQKDFWNGFDLQSIPTVTVPANTTLTIEVYDPNKSGGAGWVTIKTATSDVAMSHYQIGYAIASSSKAGDVTGIRFTFTKDSGKHFSTTKNITVPVVFKARSTWRHDGQVSTDTSTLTNHLTTEACGQTVSDSPINGCTKSAGTKLHPTADTTATADLRRATGGGGFTIGKSWSPATIDALSGKTATTTISWRIHPGTDYHTVHIVDPKNPTNDGSGTAFDAFDLVKINPVPATGKNKALKYDTITTVELYKNGSWVPVTATNGSGPFSGSEGPWQDSTGKFLGYTLTSNERANTTGVRITIKENTNSTNNPRQSDPAAPNPGSGVATTTGSRTFDMTWRIRNTLRSDPNTWVTEGTKVNDSNKGQVNNTVKATDKNKSELGSHSAYITVDNDELGVKATKTAGEDTMGIPASGTDASKYPTVDFTVTAHNDSSGPAQYIQLTDSPICRSKQHNDSYCRTAADASSPYAPGNPYTTNGWTGDPSKNFLDDYLNANGFDWDDWESDYGNIFNRFTLTGVDFSATKTSQVDLSNSTVYLLKYSGGTFSTTTSKASTVDGWGAGKFTDVVGIAVTFDGRDSSTGAGQLTNGNILTMTLHTQLRKKLRDSGKLQTLDANEEQDVTNRVFAQSYDHVLNPKGVSGDRGSDTVTLTGGDLNIHATKSISPASMIETDRENKPTVTATIGATDGGSSLQTKKVVLTDSISTGGAFWKNLNFTGLTDNSITWPTGADQIQVSLCTAMNCSSSGWTSGPIKSKTTTQALPHLNALLPAVSFSLVTGVKVAFSHSGGGSYLSNASWGTAKITFTAEPRDTVRGLTDDVTNGTVENTVKAETIRSEDESKSDTADDTINFTPGTLKLKVNKTGNNGIKHATPGNQIPWTLTFENTGTGYLDISEIRDTLPSTLVYAPDATHKPSYSTSSGGTLSTDGDHDITVTQQSGALVFTWNAGMNRMSPGEKFTITLYLELQPLSSGEHAINKFYVETDQTLSKCTNIKSYKDTAAAKKTDSHTTDAWEKNQHRCGDQDYVELANGAALFMRKGVDGSQPGAVAGQDGIHSGEVCSATKITIEGSDYYRAPCAANSQVGGTDNWALEAVNSGNKDITSLTMFDALPQPNDLAIVNQTGLGTDYRPQLTGKPATYAPNGTTVSMKVTTISNPVCKSSWGYMTTETPCDRNGENWKPVSGGTAWAEVTGMLITFDFSGKSGGVLKSGETVAVTYSTTNVPVSNSNSDGAPTAVGSPDKFAWNQSGVKYQVKDEKDDNGAKAYRAQVGNWVGAHLLTGSLEIDKKIDGPVSEGYKDSTEFSATVKCTIGGNYIDMGDGQTSKTVTFTAGDPATIPGIPVGASCTVTEDHDSGWYDESSRGSGGTASVEIGDSEPLNEEGNTVATLTNIYEKPEVTVEKTVNGSTDGEFDFTLTPLEDNGEELNGGTVINGTVTGSGEVDWADGSKVLAFQKYRLEETSVDTDTWIPEFNGCTVNGETSSGYFTEDGNTVVFTPQPGDDISCDFTNTKRPTIKVEKTAKGGDWDSGFTLTPINPSGAPVDKNVSVSAGDSQTVTFGPDGLAPGTYTLTEPKDSDWEAGTMECTADRDDFSPSPVYGVATVGAKFTAEAGDVISCTITNTKRPQVTITKKAEGGSGTFYFGLVAGNVVGSNGTDLHVNNDGSNSHTWGPDGLTPGETYTLFELPWYHSDNDPWWLPIPTHSVDDDWYASFDECTGVDDGDVLSSGALAGIPYVTFKAPAGADINCTFDNQKRPEIEVSKTMFGGDEGSSFTFTLNGPGLGDDGVEQTATMDANGEGTVSWGPKNLAPGKQYTLSEPVNPAWTPTFKGCYVNGSETLTKEGFEVITTDGQGDEPGTFGVTFTPEAGDSIDCVIINTYIASGPQCTVNNGHALYALTDDGQMKLIDTNGVTIADFGQPASDVDEFNGLGIGSGGPTYAFDRSGRHRNVELYEFDNSTGTWSSTGKTVKTNGDNYEVVFVTGVVDASSNYYFGGFSKTNNETRFYLWKYDGSSISKVGYIHISDDTWGVNNGDIAFDSNGDLFIVHNPDSHTSSVFSVTANNLAAATGGQMPATEIGSFPTIKNVNGIAFGPSGTIYLGSNTAVHSYGLPGFSGGSQILRMGSGSMSDLASCGSSLNTLTVAKDLPNGRASSGDQFTLTVAQSGSETSHTVTTDGSDSGVQSQVVGPLLVSSDETFTIAESTGTDSTNLGDYTTVLTCSADGVAVAPVEGEDHQWTVSMPDGGAGSVTCTVTNTYNPPFNPPNNPEPITVLPDSAFQCTLVDGETVLSDVQGIAATGVSYDVTDHGDGTFTVKATADSGYELEVPADWTGNTSSASITLSPDTVTCVGGESSTVPTSPTTTPTSPSSGVEGTSPTTSTGGITVKGESSTESTTEVGNVAYTGVPAYRMGFIALMLLLIGGAFITVAGVRRSRSRKH